MEIKVNYDNFKLKSDHIIIYKDEFNNNHAVTIYEEDTFYDSLYIETYRVAGNKRFDVAYDLFELQKSYDPIQAKNIILRLKLESLGNPKINYLEFVHASSKLFKNLVKNIKNKEEL